MGEEVGLVGRNWPLVLQLSKRLGRLALLWNLLEHLGSLTSQHYDINISNIAYSAVFTVQYFFLKDGIPVVYANFRSVRRSVTS